MSQESEFSIVRQEYGYSGIGAIGLKTNGALVMADSLDDFPVTQGLTRVIKNPPVAKVMSAPIKVYFDASKICPLGCDHCAPNAPGIRESHERIPSLRDGEVRQIIHQIIDSGTMEVKLGGGEPFIYAPFWNAVEELSEAGISVSTSTSGITLSDEKQLPPEKIDLLARKKVKISLSIDGEPNYHDRLRKKDGLLDDMLTVGIDRLIRHGVPKRKIEFRSTILHTEESVNQLDYLNALASKFQIRTRIRLARPAGGAVINGVAVLEPDVMTVRLFRELREIAKSNPYINLEESLRFDELATMKTGLDCGAGTRAIGIGSKGEATACSFLEGFFPGSHSLLNGQTLLEIWQHGEAILKIREYLQSENAGSSCTSCTYVDACQGGCPSVRLSLNVDKNPLCPITIVR